MLCLSKGTNHFINIIWTVTDIIWCFITAVKQILILNLTTSVARLQAYLTVSQFLGDKPKWLLAANLSGCWLQTVSTHFLTGTFSQMEVGFLNSHVFRERLGGVMSNKYKKRLARKRQEKLRGFAELVISSYYFNIVSWCVLP